ncbi:MAG: iron ABC transporter permease [Oscillospiraceae bacterium]
MKSRFGVKITVMVCALVVLMLVSACIGRYMIGFRQTADVLRTVFGGGESRYPAAYAVLTAVRLPRILCAVLIGAALSAAGTAFQGIFRNPMVSPDLLGASAGAGFGAALGFLLGLSGAAVWALSFIGGIAAVGVTCLIGGAVLKSADDGKMTFMLCGIITGSLFQALISLVKYAADPFDTMPSISFWLMGGLTYITARGVLPLALPVIIGLIPLLLIRWRINILSLSRDEAQSMGLRTGLFKAVIILSATLMTAACVAAGGMIGWIGLVIPHIARMIAGADYRRLLPCAVLLGAIFMLAVDDIARCAFAQELPIGILTAIIGAPIFIRLLAAQRGTQV